MSSKMWYWKCPVCGKELKIGPAMINFAPYCSDPKCSYNKNVFATADSTTTTNYENTKEEKHET